MTVRWLLVLLLAVLAGCAPSRSPLGDPSQGPNLIVRNTENYHSQTVYVDGVKLGTVEKDYEGEFTVRPGRHEVELRNGNDLNPRRTVGVFDFAYGKVVRI